MMLVLNSELLQGFIPFSLEKKNGMEGKEQEL